MAASHGTCASRGILPSTLPWDHFPGDWSASLVVAYTGPSGVGMTISEMIVPMAPGDGVFESSQPAVFPTELANSRFVTEGESWNPAFQVSGATADSCDLSYLTALPWPQLGATTETYHVQADADGVCAFDVPPIAAGEYHQYGVEAYLAGLGGTSPVFAGSVTGILVAQPPVIDLPVDGPGGDTSIGVDAGSGQGLAVDVEVVPDPGAPILTGDSTPGPDLAAETPVCADRAVSTNLQNGGSIPHLDALCGLAPGDYIATARMVDAVGSVTTSERAFTVEIPRPRIAARTPTATTNVPRNIRPTMTFDMDVTGVSGTTVRLRDVASGAYLGATVSFDTANRSATLRPASLLGVGRSYRVDVSSAILNLTGQSLAATTWTFKVSTDGTRPAIIGRTPARNTTRISRSANLLVRFSEPVRGVSTSTLRVKDTVTGRIVPAVVTYDSARRQATINPSSTLRVSRRYVVLAGAGITDVTGNALIATSWAFRTR
jgi:hypothetical protein